MYDFAHVISDAVRAVLTGNATAASDIAAAASITGQCFDQDQQSDFIDFDAMAAREAALDAMESALAIGDSGNAVSEMRRFWSV